MFGAKNLTSSLTFFNAWKNAAFIQHQYDKMTSMSQEHFKLMRHSLGQDMYFPNPHPDPSICT